MFAVGTKIIPFSSQEIERSDDLMVKVRSMEITYEEAASEAVERYARWIESRLSRETVELRRLGRKRKRTPATKVHT